jgi:hypothetical protein
MSLSNDSSLCDDARKCQASLFITIHRTLEQCLQLLEVSTASCGILHLSNVKKKQSRTMRGEDKCGICLEHLLAVLSADRSQVMNFAQFHKHLKICTCLACAADTPSLRHTLQN